MEKAGNIFLKEAIEIGEEILLLARSTDDGVYWLSHNYDGSYVRKDDLYSGGSGILLFLVELYKQTGDKRYLDIARQGAKELIASYSIDNENNMSFYVGLGGHIYVLLLIYELTKDEQYLEASIKMVQDNNFTALRHRLESQTDSQNDILAGSAGYILSLLHIIGFTQRAEMLQEIEQYIDFILSKCILYKHGIAWGRNCDSIKPLCGFAHGASGIGFLFMQLYSQYKQDIFLKLAKQTFLYEDQYFNSDVQNWPDMRMDLHSPDGTEALKKNYATKNMHYFSNPGYMNAWCHGAPGIAMARLYYYRFTEDKQYLKHLKNIVQNILTSFKNAGDELHSYSICHGMFGNASLLLEIYKILGNQEMLRFAHNIGLKGIQDRKKYGFYRSGFPKINAPADPGLFMGLSGIGLYYLQLVDPHKTISVLAPSIQDIPGSYYSKSTCDDNTFLTIILKKFFKNSVALGQLSFRQDILHSGHLQADIAAEISSSSSGHPLKQVSLEIDMAKNDLFQKLNSDIFFKYDHTNNIQNNSCFRKKYHRDTSLLDQEIQTSPYLELKAVQLEEKTVYFLLSMTYDDTCVVQQEIEKKFFDILIYFRTKNVARNFLHDLFPGYPKEIHLVSEFTAQVNQGLEAGALYLAENFIE